MNKARVENISYKATPYLLTGNKNESEKGKMQKREGVDHGIL